MFYDWLAFGMNCFLQALDCILDMFFNFLYAVVDYILFCLFTVILQQYFQFFFIGFCCV